MNLARINGDGSLHSWKSEYELNGTVSALAFDEASTLYLGGSFTGFGLLNGTSYGAPLDPTTGAVSNLGASLINNVIKASIPDGSGGWYIGGSFTTVGGVTAPGVAHLASDGTYLSNLNLGSITGAVSALKLVGTTLYIGGAFRWLFLALVTEYLASY